MTWGWHVVRMGTMRDAYSFWLENLKGIYQLVRPSRRWEDNIRMDLREIGWEGVDWMHLAQDSDQ